MPMPGIHIIGAFFSAFTRPNTRFANMATRSLLVMLRAEVRVEGRDSGGCWVAVVGGGGWWWVVAEGDR